MAAGPHVLRDVIVVLPGILGSTLAQDGRLVWAPSAGAALRAIATFGSSIRQLALPAGIGDEHPDDGVEPVALMPDLHVLPGVWSWNLGYSKLLDGLRSRFHLVEASPSDPDRIPNLLPVPYDWRLSNRYNARRLTKIIEPVLERWRSQGGRFADAKLIFICHSMGGLVARWYIEMEGGAEVTRKVITLGTPYRGALNALGQLVNGVRKGIGPLRLDLTAFGRSLPALHQLLPEYACVESAGELRKTTEVELPELDSAMVADAMRFHDELDQAAVARPPGAYDLHPIVGFRQPTATTARVAGELIEPVGTISGDDEGGDATVPCLSATPSGLRPDAPGIHWVADQHGALQSNQAVLDQIEGILTASPVVRRAEPGVELGVEVDEMVGAGEVVRVAALPAREERLSLQARAIDERGRAVEVASLRREREVRRGTLGPLAPGAYRIVVDAGEAAAGWVEAVTTCVLVWDPEAV